ACASWLSSLGSTPGWAPQFFLRQMRYSENDLDQGFEGLAVDLAGLDSAPKSMVIEVGQMLVKRLSLPQTNPSLIGLSVTPNPTDYPERTVAALALLVDRLSEADREKCTTFLKGKLSLAHTWLEGSRIAEAMRPFAGDQPLYQEAEKAFQEMKKSS